jgi:hypothetical protein
MTKPKCQIKFKAQMTKKKRKNGTMEHWNTGLTKNLLVFPYDCIIPTFYYSRIIFLGFDIHLRFACLRVVPPCGTKAGIWEFGLSFKYLYNKTKRK